MSRRHSAVQVRSRPFRTEAALVRALVSSLRSGAEPWCVQGTTREFLHQSGRTDVVAVSGTGQVVAFEAKLDRWRDAMHQAYRNTCYSHLSYVVLPEAVAVKAKAALPEFQRRGVGICMVSRDGQIVVLHDPQPAEPLHPWLSERASAAAKPVRACRTKSSKQ